jgi:hypothetical protein
MTDWGAHHFGGATFAIDVRDLEPEEVVFKEEERQKFLTFRYPNGKLLTTTIPGMGNMHVVGTPGEKRPQARAQLQGHQGGIYGDFIECVKTREKPFRDIEIAINTMSAPLLAMAAYKLQRSLKWDAEKVAFVDDAEANRLVDRARREPWQL